MLKDVDSLGVDWNIKGCKVGLNYVESIVDWLEKEEDDKYVVSVLELFIVGVFCFFNWGDDYFYECD